MPDPQTPGDRTPEQRDADHASLARLSDTLVPALVRKLAASGLGELEVREGEWRIRLRRSAATASPLPARRPERPWVAPHVPDRDGRAIREPVLATPVAAVPDESGETRRSHATSPAVGVFRPSAQVGARLRAGDRIGIVDLLGIPQDVIAPVDGTLLEILVPGGEAVEYGEVIASLEPAPGSDDGRQDAGEAPGGTAASGGG
jgi:acetyl-CoA carboxylase biotin carboxyl carrier protein